MSGTALRDGLGAVPPTLLFLSLAFANPPALGQGQGPGQEGPGAWGRPEAIRAEPFKPTIRNNQPWSIADLTSDAGYLGVSVNSVAIDPEAGGAWVAMTLGLDHYDGYHWRRYTQAEGIPSLFARCVAVAKDGTVWVGTDKGVVVRRPGERTFEAPKLEGSPAGPSVRRIVQAPDGAIWLACDRWPDPVSDAGLTRIDPATRRCENFRAEGGLPADHVYDCFFDSKGDLYVLTSKGVAVRRGEGWAYPLKEAGLPNWDQPCISMCEAPGAGMKVIGARQGFYFDRGKGWEFREQEPAAPATTIVRSLADGTILSAARREGQVIWLEFTPEGFREVARSPDPAGQTDAWIEDMREGPDGAVWAVASSLLVRWDRSGHAEWAEVAGVPSPRFEDKSGRVWFLDGGRAVRLVPGAAGASTWERLPQFGGEGTLDPSGVVWERLGAKARRWGDDSFSEDDLAALGLTELKGLAVDDRGHAWGHGIAGAQGTRLVAFDGKSWRALGGAEPELVIHGLQARPGGGAYAVASIPGRPFELLTLGDAGVDRLVLDKELQVDSSRWFSRKETSLVAEDPPRMLPARAGDVWFFSHYHVAYWSSGTNAWNSVTRAGAADNKLNDGVECGDSLWFGGIENFGGARGLSELRGGSWSFRRTIGIPAILNRAVVAGRPAVIGYDGVVQICDPSPPQSVSRIAVPAGTGVLVSAVRDGLGSLWLGTDRGVQLRFRADGVPPETFVEGIGTEVRSGRVVPLRAWAVEKFRPRETRHQMRFSYRVDEGVWTPFAEEIPPIATDPLSLGWHRVEVRSMDEGDDLDPSPASTKFQVVPIPLQERAWFLPAVMGAGGLLSGSLLFALFASRRAVRAARVAEAASLVKSAFLTNVSHEIRTPMNAVLGLSKVLLDGELSSEQRECARAIRNSGDALMTIINDILDFSNLESGQLRISPRPFHPGALAETAASVHALDASRKGLEIIVRVREGIPAAVESDPARTLQILNALLSNAIKFTPAGEVVVDVRWALGTLFYQIDDTGPGLPPELVGDQYEPFTLGDASRTRRFHGAGMGLAVAARLARLMGGGLHGANRPDGSGASFCLEVPAPVAVPASAHDGKSGNFGGDGTSAFQIPAEEGGPAPRVLAGRRLLIVEDNETAREWLRASAESWGMVPLAASEAAQALELARAERTIDATVVDLGLPEPTGLELATSLRDRLGPGAVVVVLASLGTEEEHSAQGRGFTAVLAKPVRLGELRRSLAEALEARERPFPGGPRPAPAARKSEQDASFDPTLGRRFPLAILVAEDLAVNRKVIEMMLRKMGYSVDLAENGREAVEAVRRRPYDLILMDLLMPEMDGLEATRVILEELAKGGRPRVVALTANTQDSDQRACKDVGMDDLIPKPVSPHRLAGVLVQAHSALAGESGPEPAKG